MAIFQKATKKQARARIALIGPAGSGKTYSALRVGCRLGQRVAVIDSERGSASKYADRFDFDVLNLDSFEPQKYVDAIRSAEAEGYDVIVIDSLSHAWMGKGGALEQVDSAKKKREHGGSSFNAWRDVTPIHNGLVDAMLQSRSHIIATIRSKTEYVIEKDDHGKSVPKKVGMAPVQRDGLEYEFDIVGDLDTSNNLQISKTRCSALAGSVISKPDEAFADIVRAWLTDGAEMPKPWPERFGSAATPEDLRKLGAEWHAAKDSISPDARKAAVAAYKARDEFFKEQAAATAALEKEQAEREAEGEIPGSTATATDEAA